MSETTPTVTRKMLSKARKKGKEVAPINSDRIYKNSTPNKRPHVASDMNVQGKLFIGFVAVILHVLMENRPRKRGLLNSYTVNQAFDLLRKIRVGITSSGKKVLQEVPSKTRALLEKIDVLLPKM